MSYRAKETSNQDGAPVALYLLEWGETQWRYTSADQDVTLVELGEEVTYTAITISDDGVRQGGSSNNDLTVKCQSDLPIVDLFRSTPPSGSIMLTIRRKHVGDAEVFVHWIGLIGNVKPVSSVEAVIVGRTLLSTFNRTGLRLCWTRGCPHIIYDNECRVDPEDFKIEAEITALTGNTITVDAAGGKAIGWFDGGFFSWQATAEGTIDRRGIEKSLTDKQFRVFGSTDRLEVGMAVKLYPGCDLTTAMCDDKFDNLPNFGGLEQMTGKNPFDGTPLF